jgi:hypothetical protein
MNIDAEFTELRTHWRIDIAIAACDLVTGCTGKRGNTAHECSANSEYV